MKHLIAGLIGLLAALASVAAVRADGPGPDAASDSAWPREARDPHHRAPDDPSTRPPRRIMGGPGYAGSAYGLGKPSFYGIGSRPDWGRSNVD